MKTSKKPTPLFELGKTVITPGAIDALRKHEKEEGIPIGWSISVFFKCHQAGDWGELDEHDQKVNEDALATGGRIMSVYHLGDDDDATKVWVVTDAADAMGIRPSTTILLPEEY